MSQGLRLEKAGIAYDPKGIKVSDGLRTTNRRVYAMGDVAGSLRFTHVAGYHAGLAVRLACCFGCRSGRTDGSFPG